jgi:GAF domain-containing protein
VGGICEQNPRKIQHRLGEGYAGWIAKHGHKLVLSDFEAPSETVLQFYGDLAKEEPTRCSKLLRLHPGVSIRSYAGFPLVSGRRVVGVLQAFYNTRETVFSEERLLEMIAARLGRELYDRDLEERRNQIFAIPSIESGKEQRLIRGVVDAAIRVTGATHGWYMQRSEVDGCFRPRAVRCGDLHKRDISGIEFGSHDIINYVSRARKEFVCPDLENASASFARLLHNSFVPVGVKAALIIPVFLKTAEDLEGTPEAARYNDLGVLVLYSYRKGAFQEDDVIVSALVQLVSYHIWGVTKLNQLRMAQAQVSRLEESVSLYNKMAAATAAAPGAVHTARKHVDQVMPRLKKLSKHPKIRENEELLSLVTFVHHSVQELNQFHDRMHEMFAFKPRFEPCSLESLLKEVRSFMDFTFTHRNIRLTLRSSIPADYETHVDMLLMKVVFINLFQNSVEAGAHHVTIRLAPAEIDVSGFPVPGVQLLYSDDGVGIAREDWEQVFEPFFTKNKEKGSGTGLGMAVAKDILARHSGSIQVQSSTPGKGVIFSLQWPCRHG